MLFLPEVTILGGGLLLYLLSLGRFDPRLVRSTAAGAAVLSLAITVATAGSSGTLFFGAFKVDLFTQIIKSLVISGTFIILLFSADSSSVRRNTEPEYYLFMLMSVFGLMMLISATELLAIFISLELSSFTVYLMVGMRRFRSGRGLQSEAAIKYLLYGVVASGLMLFGMSYLYGLTGSTKLAVITPALATLFPQPVAVVATLMVLAGFFYKVALFPLHFWVPDVYEGAGNEATAFIATVPKVVGTALLIRIVSMIPPAGDGLTWILGSCAIISMFYGNLSALAQSDIKRLLGFSGIAHAGFALLAVSMMGDSGYAIAMYYIIGYMVMNLACFLVICTLSSDGRNLNITDMSGLWQRSPLLAVTLAVALFALAGIPPFVGFMGKFMVMVETLNNNWLAFLILATINTAIAIYYYLSIVRQAWCSDDENRPAARVSLPTAISAVFLLVSITVLGVFANPFVNAMTVAVMKDLG